MTKEWDRSVESIVTIYMRETGEIVEVGISAGPSVGGYLARQAGATGVLSLWHKRKSVAYPLDVIDHWEVEGLAEWQERQQPLVVRLRTEQERAEAADETASNTETSNND